MYVLREFFFDCLHLPIKSAVRPEPVEGRRPIYSFLLAAAHGAWPAALRAELH
jgi:hypothetical protein